MSVADAELIYLRLLYTVCNASMRVTFALEQAAARQCLSAACQPVFASLWQIFAVHCPVLRRKHCVLIHAYHTSS